MPVASKPDDHQRDARGAVGQPAEDRFADEARRRPGRDDEAQRREVDALLGEVERQDGQQPAEAEPHDELGDEERQDAAPLVEPEREAVGCGGSWSWRPKRCEAIEPIARARPGTRRMRGAGRRGRPARASPVGRHRILDDPPDRPLGSPPVVAKGMPMPAITAEGLVKIYRSRKNEVRALDGLDLTVEEGHRPRPARAERRRQDDDGPHPGHAAAARRRPRHGGRLRRRQAGPAAPLGHRPVRPVRGRRREPDRSREPVDVRAALPALERRGAQARPTSCSSSST